MQEYDKVLARQRTCFGAVSGKANHVHIAVDQDRNFEAYARGFHKMVVPR